MEKKNSRMIRSFSLGSLGDKMVSLPSKIGNLTVSNVISQTGGWAETRHRVRCIVLQVL